MEARELLLLEHDDAPARARERRRDRRAGRPAADDDRVVDCGPWAAFSIAWQRPISRQADAETVNSTRSRRLPRSQFDRRPQELRRPGRARRLLARRRPGRDRRADRAVRLRQDDGLEARQPAARRRRRDASASTGATCAGRTRSRCAGSSATSSRRAGSSRTGTCGENVETVPRLLGWTPRSAGGGARRSCSRWSACPPAEFAGRRPRAALRRPAPARRRRARARGRSADRPDGRAVRRARPDRAAGPPARVPRAGSAASGRPCSS